MSASSPSLARRAFLRQVVTSTAALATGGLAAWQVPLACPAPSPKSAAETSVRALWESLTAAQREEVCFDWNYRDKKRGLLRTFVANHWQITRPCIRGDFFTKKQQWLIHDIFKGIIHPDWYAKFLKQLRDDTLGHEWGTDQSIALFGRPDQAPFQFVMTGRHLTLRADGHTEGRVALGGPIFYGHAATGFNEEVHHPGNVFWPQALEANKLYQMLDGKQRRQALVAKRPKEERVEFHGVNGSFPGLPIKEMSEDQKKEMQQVLRKLVEPFRVEERDGVLESLDKQGGLDRCSIAFYEEDDLGDDGEWDNWRLEGPAFVWYFRGSPHVHVWVNVANDPAVTITARNGVYLYPDHDPLGAYPKGSPPPEQP